MKYFPNCLIYCFFQKGHFYGKKFKPDQNLGNNKTNFTLKYHIKKYHQFFVSLTLIKPNQI